MKIAAITITYNDDYKFKEWVSHYEGYKNELYLHIIVDNGSEKEYLEMVKNTFTNSVIIERTTNGGCTGAYNDGIRYALNDPSVEGIMLIGNDMKMEKNGITKLYDFLYKEENLGMVAPILLEKDSTISDYGCKISRKLILEPFMNGKPYSDVIEPFNYCETVTGGINIAKRKFYEELGLQDEKLFMYSDEVDIGIRGKQKGFLFAVTKDVVALHMHIEVSKNAARHPFSRYLIARNKVYLAYKHFGFCKAIYVFLHFILHSLKGIIKSVLIMSPISLKESQYELFGSLAGIFNNMQPNKYSKL